MAQDQAIDNTAWTLSQLGQAIGTYVDRTIYQAQTMANNNVQYGIENGQIFYRGSTAPVQQPVLSNENTKLLVIAIVIYLLVKS